MDQIPEEEQAQRIEEIIEEEVEDDEAGDSPPDGDGSLSITPWIPPWMNLASQEEILGFFSRWTPPPS